MDDISLQNFDAVYNGSKQMSLQDVATAKATGFNAAADDYMERGIDLNEQLITNKLATYFLRMNSDAMSGAGISCGDILIVDKSLSATDGKIIVASCNSELLVRRLCKNNDDILLLAENKNHPPISVGKGSPYSVWGVVTYVIHIVS